MSEQISVNQVTDNTKQIYKITLAGLAVNFILTVVKFILGVLGNSQALVADAIHSFSDLGTDFAVIIGARYWTMPADDDHPYGHRRIESFVTAAIGMVLIVVAIKIGYGALITIRDSDIQQPGWVAFIGAILSIIIKEILYRWTIKHGKRVKSSAVIANAWHHRSDAFSSFPVALAVFAAALSPRWSFLDRVGAFVVSLFILYVGLKIMKSAISEVLDIGASEKHKDMMRRIILSTEGVKSFHGLRTRKVGPGWYVDVHVQVNPQITVKEGHDISGSVKRSLMGNGPDVLDVIIHLEP
ncbi:MAG: cation diffusion facilitator family transporter [Candidatus Omnitrophota bacterium]